MVNFRHLHCHSYYSLLDGGVSPSKLVETCKELGYDSIALTDHGTLSGTLDFYDEARGQGVKPILGIELYFTYDMNIEPIDFAKHNYYWDKKNYHLIVLAKNNIGYQNMLKLSSEAAINGLYNGRARCDLNLLKKYSEGLIIGSACLGGIIQAKIMDWYNAANHPEEFKIKLAKRMGWKPIVPKAKGRGKNRTFTYEDGEEEQLKLREAAYDPDKYMREAEYYLQEYKNIFGEDFYLELQTSTEDDQRVVNLKLIDLAEKHNVELIVTCDVHYATKEDHDFHDSLLCLSMGKLKSDEDRMKYKNCYYVMTPEEVLEHLGYLPKDVVEKAMENTYKISQQCNVTVEYGKIPFPNPGIPKDKTPEQYLEDLTYKGLYKYSLQNSDIDARKYREQIDYELGVINNAGFAPYFLVVRDYIEASNEQCNCPTGPGRGSGAGSLVTYFNGITRNIDPIKNGLLFERFLSPERLEMPDVDTDFEYRHRQDLVNYLYDKYTRDCVSRIMTITREGIKYALKDAARVLGYDAATINALVKQLPVLNLDDVDIEPEDDYNGDVITPEIALILEDIKVNYHDVYELAMRFYGMPRSYGMHASGVLITGEPIMNHIPLKAVKDNKTGEINICTQFDHHPVEKLGGIKFDILGLKTLSVLQYSVQLTGKDIDLSKIDFNDKRIYQTICSGNTEGLFQIESNLFKSIIKNMQPNSFNDISALVALGRPGPLGAGLVDKYVNRKSGKEAVEYDFDALAEIESDTFGVFVYQEQLMQAAQILAGYTLGQADSGIRKPMAKKNEKLMTENRTYFVYGKAPCPNPADPNRGHKDCTICGGTGFVAVHDNKDSDAIIPGGINRGYDEDKLNELYDQMMFFGEYAFNRSHSAAYAVICCQTAYMKTYYPAEFMAALISFAPNAEKVGFYLNHCKQLGLGILMPDVNKSYEMCTVEDGNIRLGFSLIKGVSSGATYIIEERKKGEFTSLENFYSRINKTKVNKKKFEALIKAGCFASLDDRNCHAVINDYLEMKGDKGERLFPDVTRKELMEYELELFGTNIIHVSNFQRKQNGDKLTSTGIITAIRTIKDKRGNDMAFVKMETKEDEIEVVIFSKTYAKHKLVIAVNNKIQVVGKKDNNKMIADTIRYDKESA